VNPQYQRCAWGSASFIRLCLIQEKEREKKKEKKGKAMIVWQAGHHGIHS
jgi:hypothetical protein